MSGDELIEAARRRGGSDDFGPDSWREGFEVLVASLNRDAQLNELGRQVVSERLTELLVTRLEVERWFRLHPEIGDEAIVVPLFGLGQLALVDIPAMPGQAAVNLVFAKYRDVDTPPGSARWPPNGSPRSGRPRRTSAVLRSMPRAGLNDRLP